MPRLSVLLRLTCLAAALSLGLFCQEATVEENVVYASISGSDLHLDIYKPTAQKGPDPAVVLIHGGGWMQFDKSNMASMGRFLSRNGFVAFAVDYRLFDGKHNNRWPAQLDDVQRAVRWIRAHAAKYNVEPTHIGAYGHSSGGQIASLLGMETLAIIPTQVWRRTPAKCKPWWMSAARPISLSITMPTASLF